MQLRQYFAMHKHILRTQRKLRECQIKACQWWFNSPDGTELLSRCCPTPWAEPILHFPAALFHDVLRWGVCLPKRCFLCLNGWKQSHFVHMQAKNPYLVSTKSYRWCFLTFFSSKLIKRLATGPERNQRRLKTEKEQAIIHSDPVHLKGFLEKSMWI